MTHTSDKHVTDEELELVTRGKADGIYMKAPNGSPTSLNERQWSKCAPEHSRTGLETGKMYRRQLQGLSMRMASSGCPPWNTFAQRPDYSREGMAEGRDHLYTPKGSVPHIQGR